MKITAYDLLPKLEKVKQTGPDTWEACCPAHDDKNPSLSIKQNGDTLLLKCFAGCKFDDILTAVSGITAVNGNGHKNGRVSQTGSQPPALGPIVATYDYTDESGRLLFQKTRHDPKTFRVRRPTANGGWMWGKGRAAPVLYNLPAIAALRPSDEVFITEGEKDAERLISLGLTVTCNFDGAGKWKAEYNRWLAGKMVYVLADNDAPGHAHAAHIADTLDGQAVQVKMVNLPGLAEHGDVSDWLDAGHTVEDLRRECYAAAVWQPTAQDTAVSADDTAVTPDVLGIDILLLSDLLAQEFPPLIWLVDELIAKGHLVMLGGRPKSGKSWLVLQLAQAVDTGREFLGRKVRRGRVLYVPLEDGPRRVYQRCNILKWKPQDTAVSFDIAHFNGNGAGDGPGLKQLAAAAPNYDLIIIDTLIAALNGKANENDNVQMGQVINELARIAHEHDTAVLVVHHTGKGSSESIFDTLRGASALRGGYDVGMILERKQDEREAVLHAESRDVDLSSITIEQAQNGAGWEALGNGAVIQEIRAGRKVVKALQDFELENGVDVGATAAQLGEIMGISRSSAYRQLRAAEKRGYVFRKADDTAVGKKKPDLWFLGELDLALI